MKTNKGNGRQRDSSDAREEGNMIKNKKTLQNKTGNTGHNTPWVCLLCRPYTTCGDYICLPDFPFEMWCVSL